MNNVVVNVGAIGFSSYFGVSRLVGTPQINMRIAGRSTASCSVVADSGVVVPSTFAIGTLCNITNFTNQPANDGLEFLSSDADDTSKEILFIGVDTGGTVRYEAKETHAGDARTAVATTRTDWAELYEVHVPAGMIGALTVREASGKATITTVPAGTRFVSDRLFSGFLDGVKLTKVVETSSSANMRYDCDFVDVGQVLDRRLCLEDFSDTDVGTIITALLTNYLTAEGFVRTWGNVDRIHATVAAVKVDNLNAAYKPISEVLNELARIAGCSWWVTPYRVLYMAAEGDNPIPAPVTISESVAVRNLSLEKVKGNYRNSESFIYDEVWPANKTVTLYGDGGASSWVVNPAIYKIADGAVVCDSLARRVRVDSEKDILVKSSAGAEFNNEDREGTDEWNIGVVSDNASDTHRMVTCYWTDADDVLISGHVQLNGTTPVFMGSFDCHRLLGVTITYLTNPEIGGTVTISGTDGDGLPQVTYCTVSGVGDQSKGVIATSDTTLYRVSPDMVLTTAVHTTSRVLGIIYTNLAGTTGQLQHAKVAAYVSEGAFPSIAKSVEYLLVGDFLSTETVQLYCEAEYQYSVNGNSIRQSSKALAVDDRTVLTCEYTPMWAAKVVSQDDAEISAMVSLEGSGTGRYEHATILKEPILATEAAARVTAMLAKYGDFPKALSFDTYIPWWFPGQLVTASLNTNFGENATEFVVTEVTIRESDQPVTDDYKWQYHVTAQSGEDYSVFDRMEIYRQLRARQPYVAADNLITT